MNMIQMLLKNIFLRSCMYYQETCDFSIDAITMVICNPGIFLHCGQAGGLSVNVTVLYFNVEHYMGQHRL